MEVVCIDDDIFEFSRNINYSCGCSYEINADDICVIKTVDYEGEDISQYYTVCPKCGHINVLDDNLISDDIKRSALKRLVDDPYLYQKNNAKSDIIYFNMISKRIRKR